jgi:UDP-apiose/xylose synthase
MYLVDGGKNRRTFIDIEDAINAIELIYDNPGRQFSGEVVNIGAPENETTIKKLAQQMRNIYQSIGSGNDLPDLVEISGQDFYGEGYEDCERRVPEIEKLTSVGWSPGYGLQETLERAMKYYIHKHEMQAN